MKNADWRNTMENRPITSEKEWYLAHVNERIPRSRVLLSCVKAFVVGGLICCLGQLIRDAGFAWFGFGSDALSAWTAIVLVFLGALFTGLGVYDKLGAFAGAGSIVPITGFANSIVSPAMEYKPEGFVMGVGAKLFSIAGPVLVYGVCSSVAVGLISLLWAG